MNTLLSFLALFPLVAYLIFMFVWFKHDSISQQRRDGTTALMEAAQDNKTATVQRLLNRNAWVDARDKEGRTALYFAAEEGHNQVVNMLIEAGADLDLSSQRYNGDTPLYRARISKHESTVRILLRAGATPES